MAGTNLRASEFAYNFVGLENICAYCGDPSDTEDHTVPAWYVAANQRLILTVKLYKVAACRDCNYHAGKVVDRTFLARKRRIASSVRRRHQRLLMSADWTEAELAGLGRTFRDYMENSARQQQHILLRLQFLDSGAFPTGMPMFFFSGINRQLPMD